MKQIWETIDTGKYGTSSNTEVISATNILI